MLYCAKSLQLCPTLCDPMDYSPPGSSVHGILQARLLEWVAMPSSRRSSQPGTEPRALKSPALTGGFFTTSATGEAPLLKVCVCVCVRVCVRVCTLSCFSCVQLCATLWTVAHQAPLSIGFSRQEHYSGLSYPLPGDLPNPGTEPYLLKLLYCGQILYPILPLASTVTFSRSASRLIALKISGSLSLSRLITFA